MAIFFVTANGLSLFAAHIGGYAAAVGVSWIIFVSGAAVGIFFGFLFSVPRIVVGDAEKSDPLNEAGGDGRVGKPEQRLLQSNSNLERISDWLTTMIVGVTLINFSEILSFFRSFHEFLKTNPSVIIGYGALPAGNLPIVGTLLLVIGLVSGFLGIYLSTRIYLTSMLLEAEKTLVRSEAIPETAGEVVIDSMRSLGQMTKAFEGAAATRQVYPREAVETMNKLLYQNGGYRKAIKISESLLSTSANKLPEFWFYLSAAYGQKYADLLKAGDNQADAAKEEAIAAARRAVELDPRFRRELIRISNPEGPDNDLAALRDDLSFRNIVESS